MPKITKRILLRIIIFALCISVIITAPILMAANSTENKNSNENSMTVLTIWQIDSFEGGRGSRANYLLNVGTKCFKNTRIYVNVISLTSSAARQNINDGIIPDLISYGAGTYGIESIICGKNSYYTWAHGGYCFLTIDESADFNDLDYKNTVINCGIDNMSGAAALLTGLQNADTEKPTGAYVSLIAGKYKYLLGTQRDIYRLITREVAFKVKPITEFNDLFQNISVTTSDPKQITIANKYIEYLISHSEGVLNLGLMSNGKYYDNAMSQLEGLNYEYKLTSPVSERTHTELMSAIGNSDINLLKKLLK